MTTERDSGVDLDLGGRCSALAYGWTRRTFAARQGRPGEVWTGLEASFASLVDLGGRKVGITSDGIGTKIEVAERTGAYATLGFDLVAMVADDLAANGLEPTNLSNILDVDHLDERVVDELLRGLAEAAGEAGIALTGGEIAELGGRVGGWGEGMHFNWCSTAIGVLPPALPGPIDGTACRAGDAVLAVAERGLRSNGFSLARRILAGAFGERWHEARFEGRSWGELLLTPSLICCRLVGALLESGVVPSGIAHVTGGGIPDKLGRVLRASGLGAELDALFAPPPFVRELQRLGGVPAPLAYRNWNMGNAMLLCLPEREVERAVAIATEKGFRAQRAGRLVNGPRIGIAPVEGEPFAYPVERPHCG